MEYFDSNNGFLSTAREIVVYLFMDESVIIDKNNRL